MAGGPRDTQLLEILCTYSDAELAALKENWSACNKSNLRGELTTYEGNMTLVNSIDMFPLYFHVIILMFPPWGCIFFLTAPAFSIASLKCRHSATDVPFY